MKNTIAPTDHNRRHHKVWLPLLSLIMLVTAHDICQAQADKPPSARAQALCPEFSKLAETVTLARDVGFTQEESIRTIHQTAKLLSGEMEVVAQLITYVYSHPAMSPYEHAQKAQIECYQQIP